MDEAAIDLNPKLGPSWTPRGVQPTVVTPGRKRKAYVAGGLNAHTGRVLWVEHTAKSSELFLRLLEAVTRAYRRAQRRDLIVDNYGIHDSHIVRGW